MKQLPIIWHRLVKAGETCIRCGETYRELEKATVKLKASLLPLNIEVVFQRKELTEEEFNVDPSKSNEVWIADKPLEQWLGAQVGMSPCSSVCAGSSCRTLQMGEEIYETIPEELFINAGLKAAGEMLGSHSRATASSCCTGSCG